MTDGVPEAVALPVLPIVVDLDGPLPSVEAGRHRTVLALVRHGRRPVREVVVPVPADGLAPEELEAMLGGPTDPAPLPLTFDPDRPPVAVTVVVTTCGSPPDLVRTVRSVLDCVGVEPHVVIVDNRPTNGLTRPAVEAAFGDDPRVRLVEEPRVGLSSARNTGIAVATTEIVAWTDDDVVVDPWWLAAMVDAFAEPDVGLVCGWVRPLALDTEAQWWRERSRGYAGGVEPRRWELARPPAGEPLFPFAPGRIGTGANMAARRAVLASIGGFDERLGAGTLAGGGEDLDLILRCLEAGAAVRYEPAALVAHQHHETWSQLIDQARSYGLGLASYLVTVVTRPTRWPAILRRVPAAVGHLRSLRQGPASETGPSDAGFARRLRRAEAAGLVVGAARSVRWVARRPRARSFP